MEGREFAPGSLVPVEFGSFAVTLGHGSLIILLCFASPGLLHKREWTFPRMTTIILPPHFWWHAWRCDFFWQGQYLVTMLPGNSSSPMFPSPTFNTPQPVQALQSRKLCIEAMTQAMSSFTPKAPCPGPTVNPQILKAACRSRDREMVHCHMTPVHPWH